MKRLTKFYFSLLFTLFFFTHTHGQSNGFEVIKNMELLDQIYQYLEMYYVDVPQTGKLSKAGIDAMLKELDPYTVYYHESNIEDYRLMTTGQYGGIGALIRKIGDTTCIAEPYEGNPAQKSGLQAGDKILSIDGKSMIKTASDDVSSALKGPKGTTIELEIDRYKEGKKKIKVTRDEIKLPDVPYSGLLNESVGYIKLNSFTQTASTDVKTAFIDLKSKGMKELVLDLRGKGGGLLIEAVKIVNFFVERNQVVVTTKGRVEEENRVYKTLENPIDLTIPLIILIDEENTKNNVLSNIFIAITIYILFIISTRLNIIYITIILILLLVIFVIDKISKNEKETNNERYENYKKLEIILIILTILIIIIGFTSYAITKYHEYDKNFSILTFIFGTLTCKLT